MVYRLPLLRAMNDTFRFGQDICGLLPRRICTKYTIHGAYRHGLHKGVCRGIQFGYREYSRLATVVKFEALLGPSKFVNFPVRGPIKPTFYKACMVGTTGLEPATSAVTEVFLIVTH
jgi:hypothetical protein